MTLKSSCTTLIAVFTFLCSATALSEEAFENPALKTRAYMVEISRQLGVTCTHCHNLNNFKSQEKPAWAISKKHIDLVEILNQQHRDKLGIEKADCYLCHRGKLKPDYKEELTATD